MRKRIANGEISPEAYYKDQVRERETYISKGIIPPNQRRPILDPPLRPPLFSNPPPEHRFIHPPPMRPPPQIYSHNFRKGPDWRSYS